MISKDWNNGGDRMQRSGSPGQYALPDLMMGLAGVPDIATLKGFGEAGNDGVLFRVAPAGGQPANYKYALASSLVGDDLLVLAPTDARAAGRFICVEDHFDIKLAVGFATADAAVLYTVPVGFTLQLDVPWWEVTVSFTGGTSSAIGINSSNTGLNGVGDLLGSSAGDVAASLVSTGPLAKGTKGTKIGTPGAVLIGGDTIKFNRITSVFTAGAGFVHVPVKLIATP